MAKYSHLKKSKISGGARRKVMLVSGLLLLATSLYSLMLFVAPMQEFEFLVPTASRQASSTDSNAVNKIVIPKLGIDVTFEPGDESVLEKGAWHRYPERGSPEDGGNFILSAHRFNLGLTPQMTKVKSPFYNLGKLSEGDAVEIVFNGQTYSYIVSKIYDVERTAIEIEAPSDEHKLTLYSCSLKGEKAGRIVIEARLQL